MTLVLVWHLRTAASFLRCFAAAGTLLRLQQAWCSRLIPQAFAALIGTIQSVLQIPIDTGRSLDRRSHRILQTTQQLFFVNLSL
jgi:hypothetical protein